MISILRGATIDPVFNSHPRSSNYAFREQGSALVLMANEETWVSLLQATYVEFFDLRDCAVEFLTPQGMIAAYPGTHHPFAEDLFISSSVPDRSTSCFICSRPAEILIATMELLPKLQMQGKCGKYSREMKLHFSSPCGYNKLMAWQP